MHVGEMIAYALLFGGLAVAGAWFVWIMVRAGADLRMNGVFGDFPNVPREMKAGAEFQTGEGADQRASLRDTHTQTSSVRTSERERPTA